MEAAREGGSGDDDGEETPYTLEWEDPSGLRLGFGESRLVRVRYEDPEGAPVTDVVSFALVGQAEDASLSALDDRSEGGVAEVTLNAASIDATSFRLRASAPLAPEILLDVSVSDAGFGDLRVVPRFLGYREFDGRIAHAYTGGSCAEIDPRALPADDRSVPIEVDWAPVTFEGLAVGPSYAVAVTGSADGVVVAFGCADGLTVSDGLQSEIEVPVEDLVPTPDGEYDVRSELDLADAIAGQPDAWLAPTLALVTDEGGAADYLVARIADYVEASYDAAARARFVSAVDDGGGRSALESALSTPGRDPLTFVSALGRDLEEALAHPVVHSWLAIDPLDGALSAMHDVLSVEIAGEAIDAADDATLALADLAIVSQAAASVTTDAGTIEIGEHELAFPVGSLAAGTAEQVVPAARGAADLAGLVAQTLDCEDVADILADAGADADCDRACLAAGCREASVHLATSIGASLRAGDAMLGRLVVRGTAELRDDGGDLEAEQLGAGLWLGSISPSKAPIGGSFVGTRVDPAD